MVCSNPDGFKDAASPKAERTRKYVSISGERGRRRHPDFNKALVQVGSIGRPHGYRGEFVLSGAAPDSIPSTIENVFVGATQAQALAYPLEQVVPMPKVLRLKLKGFDSDTQVKAHRGNLVFVERTKLPAPDPGEFYVADLVGCTVQRRITGEVLGLLEGVEEVSRGCPDRWWMRNGQEVGAVAATAGNIVEVDLTRRVIWLGENVDVIY